MMSKIGTLIQCIQRMARGCFGSRRFMTLPRLWPQLPMAAGAEPPPCFLHLVLLAVIHFVAVHLAAIHLAVFHFAVIHFAAIHFATAHLVLAGGGRRAAAPNG